MASRYDFASPNMMDRERIERHRLENYYPANMNRSNVGLGSRDPRVRVLERNDLQENRLSFLDEGLTPELAGQALTPYQRRPQFLRRSSSFDGLDRAPISSLEEDYPALANLARRQARRGRLNAELEAEISQDIKLEALRKASLSRSRSRAGSRAGSRSIVRDVDSLESVSVSSASEDSLEIERGALMGRKGRTRFPKKHVHQAILVEKGLSFEDDGDDFIIRRALDRSEIDEIRELSRNHRRKEVVVELEDGTERVEEIVEETIVDTQSLVGGAETVTKITKTVTPSVLHSAPPSIMAPSAMEVKQVVFDSDGSISTPSASSSDDSLRERFRYHGGGYGIPPPPPPPRRRRRHHNGGRSHRRGFSTLEETRGLSYIGREGVEIVNLSDDSEDDWQYIERERIIEKEMPREIVVVRRERNPFKELKKDIKRRAYPIVLGMAMATLT